MALEGCNCLALHYYSYFSKLHVVSVVAFTVVVRAVDLAINICKIHYNICVALPHNNSAVQIIIRWTGNGMCCSM